MSTMQELMTRIKMLEDREVNQRCKGSGIQRKKKS